MATRTWLDSSGDWNDTANWSGGAVPVDNDDVVIDSGSKDIVSGLNQSGVNLNSLTIRAGYTGSIGTVGGTALQINVDGASPTTFTVAQSGAFIYFNGNFNVEAKITATNGGTFFFAGGSQGTSARGLTVGPSANVVIGSSFGSFAGVVANAGGGLTAYNNLYVAAVTHEFIAGNTVWNYQSASASSGALVTVGAGATLTVIGKYGTVGTANVFGRYIHNANTNIGTVNLYPRGTMENGGFGNFTITTQNQWAYSNSIEFAASARTTITTRNLIGS